MLESETINILRQKLEAEHEQLVSELKSIAKESSRLQGDWNADYPKFEEREAGSNPSLEEEADEVEEYETRLETEHSLESRLLEVNRALARIKNGTFGVCPNCKKDIPSERLEANPAAEFDIEHSKN